MSSTLATFLFCNVPTPDAGPVCVDGIVRTARRMNAGRSVTGVLVFDAQRLCQYREGPRRFHDGSLACALMPQFDLGPAVPA
ncbi:MAG TPA: BLUF domain-containing protein [Acidovorax sp.]